MRNKIATYFYSSFATTPEETGSTSWNLEVIERGFRGGIRVPEARRTCSVENWGPGPLFV
jgi:hypothetical protein